MYENSLSAHTSEFTGVSSFNNGKCLRPEVYKEWRNILVTFLAHSSEIRTMPKKERDMVEQMIGAMIFTGLYREIVRNKDEYYELLRVFVKYFGTRIPEDTVVYRSLSCSIGENETNLGAFWTSNLDTAKAYYNGERIFQMKLSKGTRAYHLEEGRTSRLWGETGVYKTRGCNNGEYWVDMTGMYGKGKSAKRHRFRASVKQIAA